MEASFGYRRQVSSETYFMSLGLSKFYQKYKRVVGFRYVKKGVPQQNGAGVPSGDYAVMVGNTLFDVAVGLTSAVPT